MIHVLLMRFKRTTGSLLLTLAVLALGACSDDGPAGVDPGGFNLRVETAYLVQATQTRDGAVPLVAGRDAYVRVFAVASEVNTAAPPVRVRLFHGGSEAATYDLPARSASVPTAVDQASAGTSWNMRIPGELVQPGLRMIVEVDPEDRVAESSETDNTFPSGGTPQAITVYELPPLLLTVVPVHQSSNGRTGNVTAASLESFLTLTRKLHPIGELQVTLREPYTTLAEPFDPEGNVWARVVSELEAVRKAEAGDPSYYYGVVNAPYAGGGVVGIASGIPSRTALGWDRFPDAPETMAHELGHNFGRRHAPCGGAGGSDVDYPYPQGMLGVFGMDVETGEVKGPNHFTDIMGYCESSWWVSDYTFRSVLHYRLDNDQLPEGGPRSSLLVWGRVGPEGIVLEPAFRVDAPGSVPEARGDYRVEGLTADGATLFSYSFSPSEVSDGPAGVKTFALRLPIDAATGDSLAVLRVTGQGRSASISNGPGEPSGRGLVLPTVRPPVRRVDADAVVLSWDADRYRMVMVRDAETGRVLSFARGGEARIRARAAELELTFSDGVRSASRRVTVGR